MTTTTSSTLSPSMATPIADTPSAVPSFSQATEKYNREPDSPTYTPPLVDDGEFGGSYPQSPYERHHATYQNTVTSSHLQFTRSPLLSSQLPPVNREIQQHHNYFGAVSPTSSIVSTNAHHQLAGPEQCDCKSTDINEEVYPVASQATQCQAGHSRNAKETASMAPTSHFQPVPHRSCCIDDHPKSNLSHLMTVSQSAHPLEPLTRSDSTFGHSHSHHHYTQSRTYPSSTPQSETTHQINPTGQQAHEPHPLGSPYTLRHTVTPPPTILSSQNPFQSRQLPAANDAAFEHHSPLQKQAMLGDYPIHQSHSAHQLGIQREQSQQLHETPNQAYRLTIIQQPIHARVYGPKDASDRRPIDPPPTVQIKPTFNDYGAFMQNPYFFMTVSIVMPHNLQEVNFANGHRTTAGVISQSLFRLKDSNNEDGGFFIFPDISVRVEGKFRIKFTLFEIVGCKVHTLGKSYSDVFTVYSAKDFPGMFESTFLTRSFADQGVRIRLRKGGRIHVNHSYKKRKGLTKQDMVTGNTKKQLRCSSVPMASVQYTPIPSHIGSDLAQNSTSGSPDEMLQHRHHYQYQSPKHSHYSQFYSNAPVDSSHSIHRRQLSRPVNKIARPPYTPSGYSKSLSSSVAIPSHLLQYPSQPDIITPVHNFTPPAYSVSCELESKRCYTAPILPYPNVNLTENEDYTAPLRVPDRRLLSNTTSTENEDYTAPFLAPDHPPLLIAPEESKQADIIVNRQDLLLPPIKDLTKTPSLTSVGRYSHEPFPSATRAINNSNNLASGNEFGFHNFVKMNRVHASPVDQLLPQKTSVSADNITQGEANAIAVLSAGKSANISSKNIILP